MNLEGTFWGSSSLWDTHCLGCFCYGPRATSVKVQTIRFCGKQSPLLVLAVQALFHAYWRHFLGGGFLDLLVRLYTVFYLGSVAILAGVPASMALPCFHQWIPCRLFWLPEKVRV